LTVETVLHGDEKAPEVAVYYTDPDSLGEDAVRGLFALKALAEGGYSLVGKPVLTPVGDVEETDKLRVVRAFLALEGQAEGDTRTSDFWELLIEHVTLGGYAAQNAAVELIFVARDRRDTITMERFDALVAARDDSQDRLTKQTRDDLRLACQGLVEAKVKGLKFKLVRRAEKQADRRKAANELTQLQADYPRAFTADDATLCDGIREEAKDERLSETLGELAVAIRAEVRAREQEERDKARDTRDKIDHAGK